MAPIIKTHDLKYGYIQMEILDETTGLRFYWHNNKLADKPILLFPSGMVALVKALRRAYEIYDDQVLRLAEAAIACGELVGSEGMALGAANAAAPDIQDEVIYSAVIATSKVVQIKLEVSVYQWQALRFSEKVELV